MGEVVVQQLYHDGDRSSELVDGVFHIRNESDNSLTILTQNLEPGQRFHENEIIYNAGPMEFRVMNPMESKLALAIANGIKDIYVKPGLNVLYLTSDDSSAITVSHLSDIVGAEGRIYVVMTNVENFGERYQQLVNLRTNVVLEPFVHVPIQVFYSDTGCHDQVEIMGRRASMSLERGTSFVTFIKANKVVYKKNHAVEVPNRVIFRSEIKKLKQLEFRRVKAKSLGRMARDWLCVVGFYGLLCPSSPSSCAGSGSGSDDPMLVN